MYDEALLPEGGDAGPATETLRVRQVFWATMTAVGDDLHALERGFGETKPRGEAPSNTEQFRRATQGTSMLGRTRCLHTGSWTRKGTCRRVTPQTWHSTLRTHLPRVPYRSGWAFTLRLQVKNPLADAPEYGQRVGHWIMSLSEDRGGDMNSFRTCRSIKLLEYELLMIGAHGGVAGSDATLGEHWGEGASVGCQGVQALTGGPALLETPSHDDVFRELAEGLLAEGQWI